jgi:glycosyltransferase involved in cell wall biosynthesis
MKISIALASFNGGEFIRAQLESFAAQTRLPDELVVNDDCSSDQTVAIVEDFAASSPFPVVLNVNERNLGFVQNFGRALALTTGEVVFLSDQDDVWLPEKLERMHAAMLAMPGKACLMNDAFLADEKLSGSGLTKLTQIRSSGLPDLHFVMGCCAAVRRQLVDLALPIPDSVPAHDSWLVRLADELGLCERLEIPLQYYRRHSGNVSDFFVNRALSRWSRFRLRLRSAVSDGNYDRQVRVTSELVLRLTVRADAATALVGSRAREAILHRLEHELVVLRERVRIRTLPRARRPMAVACLWRSHGYGNANPFLGALKDLVFPRVA